MNLSNLKSNISINFFFNKDIVPLKLKNIKFFQRELSEDSFLTTDEFYLCPTPKNPDVKMVSDFEDYEKFLSYFKENLLNKGQQKKSAFNNLIL